MKGNRVLIAGAGASGLAAAISAAEAGDEVLLLEASDRPGRKILASGSGRCNVMNLGAPAYHGDSRFAEVVLSRCPPERIEAFFSRCGLRLRREEGNLVYPYTLQASSVLEALEAGLSLHGIEIQTGKRLAGLEREGKIWRGRCEDGSVYRADRVIIATGGAAQPKLGGNESAPGLLTPLGHHAVPFSPALTPLLTDQRSVSGLSGIRVRCEITLKTGESILRREKGELLFSGDGVSGICVMQCARFAAPGESVLEVNLVPGLFSGPQEALCEMKRRRKLFAPFGAQKILSGLCVPKLAFAVCKQAGLPLRGESCAGLSDEQLSDILSALTGYRLKILGLRGMDRAQVSAGGLLCDEFDPRTMGSRLHPGLHAAGEALNVDGECGGYNLMFAWAGGILAGLNGREFYAQG